MRGRAYWLSGSAIAALVGHKQPWWAKHLTGRVRRPDARKLAVILRALNAPDDVMTRAMELVELLNRR